MSYGVQKAEGKVQNENQDARSAAAVLPEFPQQLKAYRTILSDTYDVLLLSTKHPLFEWLLPPAARSGEGAAIPASGVVRGPRRVRGDPPGLS